MDKTYHMITVTEGGSTLLSSDLFIDDLERARKFFVERIKEQDPSVDEEILEYALDEGWWSMGDTVVMYIEPETIFGGGLIP